MQKKFLLLVIFSLFIFQTKCVLSFSIKSDKLNEIIKENAPIVYLHSNDHYRPGNVDDYLKATDLYKGSKNLGTASEHDLKKIDKHHRLKINNTHIIRGNIEKSKTYVRVKHEHKSLYIQYFFFYPYNGAGVLKLHTSVKSSSKIDLHPFGEHQGDWEHITIRLNDKDFDIEHIYLSQHSSGKSLSKDDMTFEHGHPVIYSSRHGHAIYHDHGSHLSSTFHKHFKKCINVYFTKKCKSVFTVRGGLRNDCDENGIKYDSSEHCSLIAVENISGIKLSSPNWYYFKGRWGPDNEVSCDEFASRILHFIPKETCILKWCVNPRKEVIKVIKNAIPDKAYGNGPTGPIEKGWDVKKLK